MYLSNITFNQNNVTMPRGWNSKAETWQTDLQSSPWGFEAVCYTTSKTNNCIKIWIYYPMEAVCCLLTTNAMEWKVRYQKRFSKTSLLVTLPKFTRNVQTLHTIRTEKRRFIIWPIRTILLIITKTFDLHRLPNFHTLNFPINALVFHLYCLLFFPYYFIR